MPHRHPPRSRRRLVRAAATLFAAVASLGSAHAQRTLPVVIDPDQTHQTVTGWGASGCWYGQAIGAWPAEYRDRVLDWLYGPEGAALTIYRFNIGAGAGDDIREFDANRRADSFEVEPGVYDWSRDPHSIRTLREVVDRGITDIVFLALSAPPRLTINGLVSGGPDGGSNLKPGAEADYARYMIDITEYWRDALGLESIALSPLNEPQWRWGANGRGQEGTHATPDEVVALTRAVILERDARGVPILIEGPDAGAWWNQTPPYIEAMLADDVIRDGLHYLSIHSYWSDAAAKQRFMDWYRERGAPWPIVQSEWCQMEWGRDIGMDSGLVLANTVFEDLTIGNVEAWSHWVAVSNYDFKDGLIHYPESGDPSEAPGLVPTRRLWCLAQFSRFIRPGSERVTVTVPESAPVQAVAFRLPDIDGTPSGYACVMINATEEALVAMPRVRGASPTGAAAWVTDDERAVEPTPVTNGRVTLPPRSVVTVRLPAE